MKVRIIAGLALAVTLISGLALAQADSPAAEQWWAHIRFLASDQLAGRMTGTADFTKAEEYVQGQFKEAGLAPAGTQGFLQEVGFKSVEVNPAASNFEVEHAGAKTSLAVGTEVTLSPRIGADSTVNAPAVFAGYGFAAPTQHFDDVAGLDLKGKVAVVLGGNPPSIHGPLRAYYRTPAERWKALQAAGAIGLITIPDPNQRRPSAGGATRHAVELEVPGVFALKDLKLSATVSASAAEIFFAGSGHTLAELQSLSDAGKTLPKFPLNMIIHAHTEITLLKQFTSPNVVGLLEGSDRKLKNEYVVMSAHLDHLGVGRPINGDSIYNGAMDNAAGIASLIEVAKALSKGPQPKRSILFIAFTGEEEGELGSQYFAGHPTVDIRQIVADLNMDMYLPLFPLRYLEVQGLGESSLGNDIRAAAQLNDVEVQFDKQPDENRLIRSDQASFIKRGIPAVAFKFGWIPDSPEQKIFNDWVKNRYHKPSDDLEQPVDKNAAALFDQILTQFALRVSNAPNRPYWYPESFFASIPRS